MNILALDTGKLTGWALNYKKKTYSGTQVFEKLSCDDNGVILTFFRSWLENMIKLYDINLIIYEQPHLRGAGTQILVGYIMIVQQLSSFHGIQWIEVHSATLKKFATGNGRADKKEMMLFAEKKKWKFKTDDECDALWLLNYTVENKESNVIS